MKLYYPKSHYDQSYRGLVFPLLKPFIKGDNFIDAQRIEMYGVSATDFEFTESVGNADWVILTMAWNYYVKTKQKDLAISFVKECGIKGKKVIAYNADDFGVRIPPFENLLVVRPSGYKSKFSKNEYSLPAFISDPLKKYFHTTEIIPRPYRGKPVVGFCGQANSSLLNATKEVLSTTFRNLRFYLGWSRQEPQHLLSTSYLRASVLRRLEESPEVTCNFILRKKYRAGIKTEKDNHQTTLEFYDNIRDSDYVVCVRGAGNFSVRFYETLAMGRIPIFIKTDCALPLEKEIGWRKHVVWVEYNERHRVAEKLIEFHRALSEQEFIDLQLANRKLWEERLRLGGFFKNFNTKIINRD